MPWEWSHSAEAYDNARQNLDQMEAETIREIWAEWKAWNMEQAEKTDDRERWDAETDDDEFRDAHFCAFPSWATVYDNARNEAEGIALDILTDQIWEQAEEQRTCTIGGWAAWVCPYGCGSHLAPFNAEATI